MIVEQRDLFKSIFPSKNIRNNFNIGYVHLCEEEIKIDMAAVPQAAFAAKKVRENEERMKNYNYNMELNPMNYSSKFMNSIWGQYNRYSVHNLKKIMDDSLLNFTLGNQENKIKSQGVEKSLLTGIGSPLSFNVNVMSHH